MQSSGNLSDELFKFVNYYLKSLIDKVDSSESSLVNLGSVVENRLMILSILAKPCQIVLLLVKKQVGRL
jgi:hypothetical protein